LSLGLRLDVKTATGTSNNSGSALIRSKVSLPFSSGLAQEPIQLALLVQVFRAALGDASGALE